MKTISVKIPVSLDRRLQEQATKAGMNKSEVLRRALELYLVKNRKGPKESVAVLAEDLAGCFQGPTDLATSAEHLDEYGV
jgi:Arc/MetJ-type ribon-helix-helix transcriptional regulator